MRTALLLGIVVLGVGCAAREVDAPIEHEPVSHQVASLGEQASDVAAARLAARIDASGLALGPREPVQQAERFNEGRALAALQQATGRPFESAADGAEWAATDGIFRATLEPGSGRLHVRGVDAYDAALAHAPDELFRARAAALLGGFASDLPRDLAVVHLGGTVRTIEGEVPADEQNANERMGSKVYALRTLGGLPVAGNRLVASYRNDGQLVGVRGKWPEIDIQGSKLSSDMRPDDVAARAAEVLAAHGVNPEREDPIVLESFYELRPGAAGWVAVLRASAVVVTYNNEGEPGRRERHDFDI